ncbi:hypothetical protein QTI66_32945 [Variovorax sp. J22R133]|uniref:hypothetical protein n=1 Tax=Variovorax brevis TaxID=3053503 RepID=UPI0025765BFC|nr:hypothetical protein [Variovorax sp. J22R133]MDM0116937.1 hypothetical protein [Variovorax sp. J22R133]
MTLLFLIARAVHIAYKALRAAAGILILSQGVYRWVKNSEVRAQRRRRRVVE